MNGLSPAWVAVALTVGGLLIQGVTAKAIVTILQRRLDRVEEHQRKHGESIAMHRTRLNELARRVDRLDGPHWPHRQED